MVKMVERWSVNHKIVVSTPTQVNFLWLFLKFLSFIHTFIEFYIHNVSPAVVEACLKNSLLQYRSVQRDPMMQCHPRIWTHALVRPNYKLNCVWYRVELKVIWNLECRIKFYRGKKPPTFFCPIEYPYPPTIERLYCKRPIQCLASFKILTTHPLTTPGECVPPAFGAGGGHTYWVERGVGGQYFGRRQTLNVCKYFVPPTNSVLI
jgi:hypothetical protein